MAQDQGPKFIFEHQLRLEADRVLDDVTFQRSPIQSQLLKFLVEKTLEGSAPPTQYEIAVDGLGKDEDYDLSSDSYPRVQISRLRKNLENYYARNLPNDGLRIQLEPGTYRLMLVPGEQLETNPDPETVPAVAQDARPDKLKSRFASNAALGTVGAIAIACILLVVFRVAPADSLGSATGPAKPSTALFLPEGQSIAGAQLPEALVDTTRQVAAIQLTNSFVSKPIQPDQGPGDAQYLVRMTFGPSDRGDLSLNLALADEDGDVLYSNAIPYDAAAPGNFANELEASLVYISSPTGAIAQAELPKQGDGTSSDYACFLTIENRRSNGDATATLVDDCITRYPDSEYRAFWYARRAFTSYQADVAAGRPIRKDGTGWSDLQTALDADPFNAFANFTASKVELAQGRCAQAIRFVNRALERGSSYPALVAAVETNAASCSNDPQKDRAAIDRIRALVRFNPDPDPLLQLYLMVASLAANDRATAAELAQKGVIQTPEGPVDETADLLRRSLADRDVAEANREQLSSSIRLFVWNERATRNILDALTS